MSAPPPPCARKAGATVSRDERTGEEIGSRGGGGDQDMAFVRHGRSRGGVERPVGYEGLKFGGENVYPSMPYEDIDLLVSDGRTHLSLWRWARGGERSGGGPSRV